MARRHATPAANPQARELAAAIRQGERAGLKQREIAATLGINPRTVRKIKSGQTAGTRTYQRVTTQPATRDTPNAFNANFIVGVDKNGNPVYASRNVIIPNLPGAKGPRTPTALDALRRDVHRQLQAVAAAERSAMAARYGVVAPIRRGEERVTLRNIGRVRRPSVTIHRSEYQREMLANE